MSEIDPDAVLVLSELPHSGPYLTYKCGCWIYTGDLDAPHERPCAEHELKADYDDSK